MPCHAAMIEKPLTVKPDDEVGQAIAALQKAGLRAAAVVDSKGVLQGVFSIRALMKNLLPVSVTMQDGVQLDVKVQAAPGIAKRLKKVEPLKVEDLMERKIKAVHPETPLWEGIQLLLQATIPVPVVEAGSYKFIGMMTENAALAELERLKDSEA